MRGRNVAERCGWKHSVLRTPNGRDHKQVFKTGSACGKTWYGCGDNFDRHSDPPTIGQRHGDLNGHLHVVVACDVARQRERLIVAPATNALERIARSSQGEVDLIADARLTGRGQRNSHGCSWRESSSDWEDRRDCGQRREPAVDPAGNLGLVNPVAHHFGSRAARTVVCRSCDDKRAVFPQEQVAVGVMAHLVSWGGADHRLRRHQCFIHFKVAFIAASEDSRAISVLIDTSRGTK